MTSTLPDTTWYLHVIIDFAIGAVPSEGIQPVPMVNDVNITRHDMILTRHDRLCHRRRTRLMYACRCRTQQWREHGIRRWPVLWSLRRLPTCNGIERLKILEVNLSWGCRVVDMPAADIPLSSASLKWTDAKTHKMFKRTRFTKTKDRMRIFDEVLFSKLRTIQQQKHH